MSKLGNAEATYRLKLAIEEFYYREADLLDERRFREWLDMLADDLVYFMPVRRNVKYGEHAASENTRQGEDISWFDEDKWTLQKRVEQIETGVHFAEEPLSRVAHMVSNIRVVEANPSPGAAAAFWSISTAWPTRPIPSSAAAATCCGAPAKMGATTGCWRGAKSSSTRTSCWPRT